jgi:hypothetical protein
MKKVRKQREPSRASLRALPEVDLGRLRRGRRGAYAHLLTGTSVHAVIIEPDIWMHFGDARAINAALRMLVDLAAAAKPKKGRPRGRVPRAA